MPSSRIWLNGDGMPTSFGKNRTGYEPTFAELRLERQMRHKWDAFFGYHMCEAEVLSGEGIEDRYVSVPRWWDRFEVEYGCRVKAPEIVTYGSSWFFQGGDDIDIGSLWCVLRTEHAMNCLIALYFHAVVEERLYWFPRAVSDIWTRVGVRAMLAGCEEETMTYVEKLVDSVLRYKWDLCPVENRQLPEKTGPFTPVFASSGDWVTWDKVGKRPLCPDDMLCETVPVGEEGARNQRVWRTGRFRSSMSGLTGSNASRRGAPHSRVNERQGLSNRAYGYASGSFNTLCVSKKYDILAKEVGIDTRNISLAVRGFGRLLFHAVDRSRFTTVGAWRDPLWETAEDSCRLKQADAERGLLSSTVDASVVTNVGAVVSQSESGEGASVDDAAVNAKDGAVSDSVGSTGAAVVAEVVESVVEAAVQDVGTDVSVVPKN